MPSDPIFFSYSRSDSGFVLKLAKDLRNAGANIWLDQLDIKAGSHWDASIETALNTSMRLIIVLSPASVASNNVMDEVSFALESNKTVIPILLTECVVPFRLRRVQRVNFTGDYKEALDQLMEVLGYSQKSSAETESSQIIPAEINPVAEQKNKELETSVWENAKAVNTLDALIDYLQQYPHGNYQTNALAAIKTIEDSERQKANEALEKQKKEDTENKLWSDASNENSISSYKKYLSETITGLHKEEAQQLINDLEKKQKEKKLEASAIVDNEKQKAIGSAKRDNISGHETIKKNNKRKYIFIGISALIVLLILWKIIGSNSEKLNSDNANNNIDNQSEADNTIKDKLDQADSFFNALQYDSAWSIYQSIDEKKLDSVAMFNIGYMYADSNWVARDYAQAKMWYQKAADAGSSDAMDNLGTLYWNEQDYTKAKAWYQKACDAGNTDGCTNLKNF